ncbi:hypothetical protein SAMN05660909_05194 [Chitinophaga terrae (ex Kim and Jung 2007)]|jgi:hypothetical protein|uniref:Uncharacterized protein n=1 Tax=Chitinophaga terrae (ex Kim and Jung 2007) TaxID=408074 RepID=A0A1H4GD39_9BACT|nr:hypothetical protein [Elizabethkingia anophelis]SEB07525.1 hypothetical protein SAMN05660909_05194 [Chitinophaga terrae (ex Kim and Jung 2007)]
MEYLNIIKPWDTVYKQKRENILIYLGLAMNLESLLKSSFGIVKAPMFNKVKSPMKLFKGYI